MASEEENIGDVPPPAGPSAPPPPAGKVKEEEVNKDTELLNQIRWMMEEAVEDGFKQEDENRSKKPSEIKIGTPSDYDGNPSTAKQWLNTVIVYIILNKHIYNDDAKRIMFAQSFMKTGPAAAWANVKNEEALQLKPNGARVGWGTWSAFETHFKSSFAYGDAKAIALNELQTLRQTGSIEEYIGKFRILAADSGIKEHIALIGYFRVGIKRALMQQIYAVEFVPITIEGWYGMLKLLPLRTIGKWPTLLMTTILRTPIRNPDMIAIRGTTIRKRNITAIGPRRSTTWKSIEQNCQKKKGTDTSKKHSVLNVDKRGIERSIAPSAKAQAGPDLTDLKPASKQQ